MQPATNDEKCMLLAGMKIPMQQEKSAIIYCMAWFKSAIFVL